jgi:hypothetical protein
MAGSYDDGQYPVYWPGSPKAGKQKKPIARRLETLAGKKIGLLWGYLFRGDEVYAVLEKALKEKYPQVSFVNWAEFGSIHGNNEREVVAALPDKLKSLGVDAVLSGMGC